jgi:hypothetical protein
MRYAAEMKMRAAPRASAFFLHGCASEPSVTPGIIVLDSDVAADTAVADGEVTPFPVQRLPCLSSGALTHDLPPTQYGALEGELVSIVPPNVKGCPSDPDHLHLQLAVGAKRYDIAVTVDSDFGAPVAIHAGFAAATFDYPRDIGTPSADYQALARDAMLARLQGELTTAARVRVYGETYSDGSGLHKVHRNGRDRDGVILVRHVDGGDKLIALRFSNDVF